MVDVWVYLHMFKIIRSCEANEKNTGQEENLYFSLVFESAHYGMVVPVMPSLLVLLSPQPLHSAVHWGSALCYLFSSFHSLPQCFLAWNPFRVTIPKFVFSFQIFFLIANCQTNKYTWMSNWHFNLTLPKWNTSFPPSNQVFAHLSVYLHSFCNSGQKFGDYLDIIPFYCTSSSSENSIGCTQICRSVPPSPLPCCKPNILSRLEAVSMETTCKVSPCFCPFHCLVWIHRNQVDAIKTYWESKLKALNSSPRLCVHYPLPLFPTSSLTSCLTTAFIAAFSVPVTEPAAEQVPIGIGGMNIFLTQNRKWQTKNGMLKLWGYLKIKL